MARRLGRRELRIRLTAGERQARAVELYLQGWTMRRIAAELGYAGPSGVKKALDGAIAKVPSRAVNELRVEIDERSRMMLEQLMPIVTGAKRSSLEERLAAIDRVLKIDKELRALHGVDAPARTQTEVSGPDGSPLSVGVGIHDELLSALSKLAAGGGEGAKDPEPDAGGGAPA